jgi:hypothetical protein
MLKKILRTTIIVVLLLSLTPLCLCDFQYSTFEDWQVESDHGYVSRLGDTLRLWTDDTRNDLAVTIFKEYQPTDDFTFSAEVNAAQLQACGLYVRGSLPAVGSFDGFNLEFGYYGMGNFHLSRNFTDWASILLGYGEPNVWYTLNLTVHRSPFLIEVSVLDENGGQIGSISTDDIYRFNFEDIKYIAISVWGRSGDYSFRNIQDPTVSANTSCLSIHADYSSAVAGSAVNVHGILTDKNSQQLENKTVVLSYSFPGVNTWIPISSCQTNEQGQYSIQWINSASGTFTLKTEWSGDSTSKGASNTTTLSFLPIQNQQTFVFESNSTVTALAFNNETSTLTFNVTGPSDTTGFVRATIAKSLLADGENLQTFLDGKQLQYTLTSTDDSWVYYFSYSHSTHQISMHLGSDSTTQPLINDLILVAIVAVFGSILAAMVISFSRRNKRKN